MFNYINVTVGDLAENKTYYLAKIPSKHRLKKAYLIIDSGAGDDSNYIDGVKLQAGSNDVNEAVSTKDLSNGVNELSFTEVTYGAGTVYKLVTGAATGTPSVSGVKVQLVFEPVL